MAENFIRVRGGLEFFSVREQILDALGADDRNKVLLYDQLGTVLRNDECSGIFCAGASTDRFHPVYHVASIGLLCLRVYAVVQVTIGSLLLRLEAIYDVQIDPVETSCHCIVDRG